MLTTIVDLSGVRGDTLLRAFPLTRDGLPLSAADGAELAARFVGSVQIRAAADDPLILAQGAVSFVTTDPPQLVIEVSGADMQDVERAVYDVQLTEARPGNLQGDLVWTILAGKIKLRKDVVRVP
ncbi:hypothetical protein ACI3L1_06770 [Deinococcus sp. SM5_A1]|uniref:hypothetical protein n=1 Tax=Deinococcus sp. SM5_A1 TaxID=3379094 RepID=UPI00385BB76F